MPAIPLLLTPSENGFCGELWKMNEGVGICGYLTALENVVDMCSTNLQLPFNTVDLCQTAIIRTVVHL